MNILFFIVPIALAMSGLFVVLFIFAVRSGQFDDLQTPPNKILWDPIDTERNTHE